MLTSNQLIKNQEFSNTAVRNMETAIEKLNATIAAAEADTSRSRDWVMETCKAARERALPALSGELKTIQAMAQASGAQQQFWESRPLVLSLQTFDSDLARNAQIKLGYSAELKAVSLPLLNLIFQDARNDKNLPLIYQCWLAGVGRTGEAGFADSVDLSLEMIDLPGQGIALAAIATCLSNRSHGETLFSVAAGMRNDPVRQMTVARQQQVSSRMTAASAGV